MNQSATHLRLDQVGVHLSGKPIVASVSAHFRAGTCVALIGPNGAGKTTLLRAMAGLIPATGMIALDGVSLAALSHSRRAQIIGYLPQGHATHWPLPARDIVALGRFPFGLSDPAQLNADDAAIVDDAMRRTDSTAFADRNVQTLSGGERARVMMARVLATDAAIILADEPTAALDPSHQISILQTLKTEAQRGKLVIFVTHDLVLAARFADRLVVMANGTVRADGPPADILTEQIMRDVYGVTAVPCNAGGQALMLPWAPL